MQPIKPGIPMRTTPFTHHVMVNKVVAHYTAKPIETDTARQTRSISCLQENLVNYITQDIHTLKKRHLIS